MEIQLGTQLVAVELAEYAGAPRHVAKTLLLLAVSQVQAGWARLRQRCAARGPWLRAWGPCPRCGPPRALLGALLEESAPAESAKSLSAARGGVIAIADDLPDDLRGIWLDRPLLPCWAGEGMRLRSQELLEVTPHAA